MSRPAAAIVTTLRNAGPSLDSFIAWHLGIGFAHLFLFFDDPADADRARVKDHPHVTAIAHDAGLKREWARLPEQQTFGAFADSEVMARQVLNAALAMELARARGFQWLLHMDADELFWSPAGSVAAHFAGMEAKGAPAVKYWNYEAVPEKCAIGDPFRAVDLFKNPPALRLGRETAEGAALLASTPAARFHFYSNGKAAVRLNVPGMRPRSVHDFDNPAAPAPAKAAEGAFILHYACCGFENFRRKYRTLGVFADRWFGKTDIRAATGSSLHLDSRDVVAAGDREKALDFYRTRIALEDGARAEALIEQGVLTRIATVKDALKTPPPKPLS